MSCNGCTSCERAGIQPYGIEEHTADGVFIKQMVIPKAGTVVPQHSHSYDHTTMLAAGSMLVKSDLMDRAELRHAPAAIFIPARVKHTFTSMVDHTVAYCIHRERDGGASVHEEHQLEGVV